MPIWRRRHELYAVWIATEIVSALDKHDFALHHQDGRITFSFRETVVATVRSTFPRVRLWAERRSPLSDPIGKGRVRHAQPDYTMWRGSGEKESCGLVVEVKHYKRGSPARFRHALVDYARAHPQANVLLVNHGPAGDLLGEVDRDVRKQCDVIGDLMPNHIAQRDALKAAVRAFVGEPILEKIAASAEPSLMLVVDVSESMRSAIEEPEFAELLRSLAGGRAATVALVDHELQSICRLSNFDDAVRRSRHGGTRLDAAIATLLEDHKRVLVLTDRDGLADLQGFKSKSLPGSLVGAMQVEIAWVEQ